MDPTSPFQEYFNFEQIRHTWQRTGKLFGVTGLVCQ